MEIDFKIFILVAFAMSAKIFAFVVNDLSDVELDALSPLNRNPLSRGEISERTTAIVALIFLTLSVSLLFLLPLNSIIIGFAGLTLCFTYSWGVRAKLKPFLDVAYHGVLPTLPFVMGYTLYKPFDETCLLLSIAVFILGAVTEVMQEIRDYDVDRTFGKTTVVVLGKRKSLTLCLGFMITWFLLLAAVFDRLLFFPVTIRGFIIPFQFLILPPVSMFISTPLIRGIMSKKYQKVVYEKFRKWGLVVIVILISSSFAIFVHGFKIYLYGDPEWENYTVKLKVRTVISGPENWSVAFIRFRYTDEDNHYYLLLSKDGVLELTKLVESMKTFLAFVKTNLSPFEWHYFEILLEGPSIKVLVDGSIYLTIIDDSLSKGMVSLRSICCARLALYKDVEVYSI